MHLWPVAVRELRVASRRGRTYWGRFGMGLATMLVAGWIWLMFALDDPARSAAGGGLALFTVLSALAFLHCLVAGFYAVDAISWEKREGTLGFLFLTDLRGHDVLAGKLAATGIHALMATAAAVPVLTVCLLLGGITATVLVRTVLVLLNTLGLSLACGLLVSTFSRDARVASTTLLLVLLCLCLGLPVMGHFEAEVMRRGGIDEIGPWFLLPSPVVAFASVFGTGIFWGGRLWDPYWWSMGIMQVLTWACLLTAARWIPWVWQEKEQHGWRWWLERCLHWLYYGRTEDRQARRARLLDLDPVCWWSSRERWRTPAVWGVLALALVGWTLGYHRVGPEWLTPPVSIGMALCLHGVFKYWLTAEACRRFAEDRAQGAFELLLSTPLTIRGIMRGRWRALWRTFGGAWVAMALADLSLLRMTLRTTDGQAGRGELTAVFLSAVVLLGVHFYALGWVGMWRSMIARSSSHAVSQTLWRVMIRPWLVFGLLLAARVMALRLSLHPLGPLGARGIPLWYQGWGFLHYWAVWLAVMLLMNLAAAFRSRHLVLSNFRRLAAEHSRGVGFGWWQRSFWRVRDKTHENE